MDLGVSNAQIQINIRESFDLQVEQNCSMLTLQKAPFKSFSAHFIPLMYQSNRSAFISRVRAERLQHIHRRTQSSKLQ